jgi:hypothetical protein
MPTPEQKNASELSEQAIALAEQLGRIAGTIEGTAEEWLNRQSLADQLTRVRDGAAEMLESLTSGAEKGRSVVRQAASQAMTAVSAGRRAAKDRTNSKKKTGSGMAATSTRKADAAHAPGKQLRKPAPSMRGVKKSDQRIPKARTAAAVRQRRKSHA